MFRKIVTWIIIIPLAAVIIAFAVANRQTVTVSFDPFSSTSPAYATTLPLFVVILMVLILGVLVGGIAAWIRQGKWRRAARRLNGEVRALHDEIESIRRRFGTAEQPAPAQEPVSLPLIPGPIP
jgi:uncharacterized integral membrane protein